MLTGFDIDVEPFWGMVVLVLAVAFAYVFFVVQPEDRASQLRNDLAQGEAFGVTNRVAGAFSKSAFSQATANEDTSSSFHIKFVSLRLPSPTDTIGSAVATFSVRDVRTKVSDHWRTVCTPSALVRMSATYIDGATPLFGTC